MKNPTDTETADESGVDSSDLLEAKERVRMLEKQSLEQLKRLHTAQMELGGLKDSVIDELRMAGVTHSLDGEDLSRLNYIQGIRVLANRLKLAKASRYEPAFTNGDADL